MPRKKPDYKQGLTEKQWAWCQEYVKDMNATQAAIRAGYSENNAKSQGWENTTKPHLQAVYKPLIDQRIMSRDELEFRISEAARADVQFILNDFGVPDIEAAKRHNYTQHIKKIKTKTIYTDDDQEIHEIEIELHDKTKYLDMLAKQHGLTNTTRIEDAWQMQALEAIKNGEVTYEDFVAAFSEDLATQLFRQAGVPVNEDVEID